MKVVNGHVIFTPANDAFAFIASAHVGQPDLLTERLGDGGFWFFHRWFFWLLSRWFLSRRLFWLLGLLSLLHIPQRSPSGLLSSLQVTVEAPSSAPAL